MPRFRFRYTGTAYPGTPPWNELIGASVLQGLICQYTVSGWRVVTDVSHDRDTANVILRMAQGNVTERCLVVEVVPDPPEAAPQPIAPQSVKVHVKTTTTEASGKAVVRQADLTLREFQTALGNCLPEGWVAGKPDRGGDELLTLTKVDAADGKHCRAVYRLLPVPVPAAPATLLDRITELEAALKARTEEVAKLRDAAAAPDRRPTPPSMNVSVVTLDVATRLEQLEANAKDLVHVVDETLRILGGAVVGFPVTTAYSLRERLKPLA